MTGWQITIVTDWLDDRSTIAYAAAFKKTFKLQAWPYSISNWFKMTFKLDLFQSQVDSKRRPSLTLFSLKLIQKEVLTLFSLKLITPPYNFIPCRLTTKKVLPVRWKMQIFFSQFTSFNGNKDWSQFCLIHVNQLCYTYDHLHVFKASSYSHLQMSLSHYRLHIVPRYWPVMRI